MKPHDDSLPRDTEQDLPPSADDTFADLPHRAGTPDVGELHEDIIQEQTEPHEGNERVPVWIFLVFLGLAMWGGWYISEHDGEFRQDVYDGPDAFRVVDYSQPGSPSEPLDPEKLGKRVFNTCITCHQADGQGIPGKYPPLNQSEWVQGDDRILARILLNGLAGPIEVKGQTYNNQMPAWKQLSDYDIAAVLTHIRQSWDNDLPSVAPSTVAEVRKEIADQTAAFVPADLQALELPEVPPVGEEEIYLQYKNAGDVATMAAIDEDKMIRNLKEEYVIAKVTAAVGDPDRGSTLFTTATCITCHVGTETKQPIAPSLSGVGQRMKRAEIIDSILHPSAKIAEGYEAMKFLMDDETFWTGSVLEETDDVVRLRLASGEVKELLIDEIEDEVKDTISPMPIGLMDPLTTEQMADLIAYLESLPPEPDQEDKTSSDRGDSSSPGDGQDAKAAAGG